MAGDAGDGLNHLQRIWNSLKEVGKSVFIADVLPLINLDLACSGKAHCSVLLVIHFKSSGVLFIVIYSLRVYSWFADSPP